MDENNVSSKFGQIIHLSEFRPSCLFLYCRIIIIRYNKHAFLKCSHPYVMSLQIIMPKLGWRWLLALSALPSLLLLIFYTATPESPRYLCLKGRKNDALKILEKIGKLNGKGLPPGVLVTDHEIELQERSLPPDGQRDDYDVIIPPPPRWRDSDMGAFRSLLMLLSPKLIRSTLLLWVVFFGNAFSYYGLVLLTTQLNNGNNKCHPNEMQSQKSGSINYKDVFITSFAGNI